jgi:signal transduction histidine kinase
VDDGRDTSQTPLRSSIGWIGAFVLYIAVLLAANKRGVVEIHNFAWLCASAAAAVSAWRTARCGGLTPRQQRAWRGIALGCTSWMLGQIVWSYYFFVMEGPITYPLWIRVLYLGYALCLLPSLGGLSDGPDDRFKKQHLGNLGLIGCCFIVTIVIMFFEPVAHSSPDFDVGLALAHALFVSLTAFAALYYLWTRQWGVGWVSMLVIVAGTMIHSLGNFVAVHDLIVGTYRPDDWSNVTWCATFLTIGLAAQLRRSVEAEPGAASDVRTARARRFEAMIPAMLIVIVASVGLAAADHVTTRVLVIAAAVMLVFALILGAREAWIQRESQRLTLELRATNELLRQANLELQASEARVRDLHTHLEERASERTRELEGAYEELEGFAYAVAHDLKAPLRAIDGFGQLLAESVRDKADERAINYLTRIRRGAWKMTTLIEDLLAYLRVERRTLCLQPVRLDELIEQELVDCGLRTSTVELHVDVPPIELEADAEALAMVVRNLLQNALKFTRTQRMARISVEAREQDGRVCIVVRDNGIGFDMQYHDQIFKLFHRLHREEQYRGNGVGLALVRKALERMHGSVRAESREGEGATFFVELPIVSTAQAAPIAS